MKKVFLFSLAALGFTFSPVFSGQAEAQTKCPPGYVYSMTGYGGMGRACVKHTYSSATFHHKMKCEAGTFFDPRNGGECWSCPSGYPRSIHPVTSDKACAKPVGFLKYQHKKAKFHRSVKCASPKFVDSRGGGECWSCPTGYTRQTGAITDNKACLKMEYKKPTH